MSSILQVKVKRPSVDWWTAIKSIEDDDVQSKVWRRYFKSIKKQSKLSINRRCYYALLHYFSRREMECYRWLGHW